MENKRLVIAKVTAPQVSGVLPRERLFRMLDGQRPVTWISGPPGSGKTTLVAHYLAARKIPCLWYQVDADDGDIATFFYYLGLAAGKSAPRFRKPLPLLTPEYIPGMRTFTGRFFEELYRRLKPPFVLVFDNCQTAPSESRFHEVLGEGLSLLPEGIRCIVISRTDPPPVLARLRMNGQMNMIEWNDLRFTPGETKVLFGAIRRKPLSAELIGQLHDKTEGWVAGLVFLRDKLKAAETSFEFPGLTGREELFDYFAGEVFRHADGETRDFLLRTSVLPKIALPIAENLASKPGAGKILAGLAKNNFFTVRYAAEEPVYQYHPLFREFLLSRALETSSPEEMAVLRTKAAALLEQAGHAEQAVELYREAGDWTSVAGLIPNHAKRLIAEGRYQTLEAWITSVPGEMMNRFPRLLFWYGTCRLPVNPQEALRHFEKAFSLFQARGDMAETLQAWSRAINAIFVGWNDFAPFDPLIRWYYEHSGAIVFPSIEIETEFAASMAGAMIWRQPSHPDIGKWVKQALTAAEKCENPVLRLHACNQGVTYYLWIGDIANALLIHKEVREITFSPGSSPLTLIRCKCLEAITCYCALASHESGLAAIAEAKETAQKHSIHVWDHMIHSLGVYGSLLKGDRKAAAENLDRMKATLKPDQSHACCQYHYVAAWHDIYFGNLSGALAHAEIALKSAITIGGGSLYLPEIRCRLALASILCEKKDYQKAEDQLDIAWELVGRSRSGMLEFMCGLTRARVALERGNDAEGLEKLKSAMLLGRSRNFVSMLWWWQPSVMTALCSRALEAGIETEYVQRLIRTHTLTPDDRFRPGPAWPWPLRITTLGAFELRKDGNPVRFSGKVQHKPLLLLKALIACGGRDVPEEQITDLLWPDSDGDAAHSAFSTTLQRLRQLVGSDKDLVLNGRRLTLDDRFCWVDAWAFEQMHEQAEILWRNLYHQDGRERKRVAAQAYRLGEKAADLYEGSFLPGDIGQTWTMAYRERLRSKFLRIVLQQGAHLEEAAEWRKAVEIFERGLETDDLTEEFYQHLMLCHQKLGHRAEAIRIYDRCRVLFRSAFGIAPSAKTEAIYSSLLR